MIELILLDSSNVDAPMTSPQCVLSRPEMKQYHMLRSDARRREFLLGRILIKAALIEKNHGCVSDFPLINIHLSVTGKPAVAGTEFNLAHDGQAILLAVGDQVVGVDIERVQSFDPSMMELCFTIAERRRIQRSRQPDRVATLLWCLKEAAAKTSGAGMVSELEGSRETRLYFRGGFLNVAGQDRAYAVCSSRPIEPVTFSPALPRFDPVFAALKRSGNSGGQSQRDRGTHPRVLYGVLAITRATVYALPPLFFHKALTIAETNVIRNPPILGPKIPAKIFF